MSESETYISQVKLNKNHEELQAFNNENSEPVNTFIKVNDPTRFHPRAVDPDIAAILDAEAMQWHLDLSLIHI